MTVASPTPPAPPWPPRCQVLAELKELMEYRKRYLGQGAPSILALGLSSRKNLCVNPKVAGAPLHGTLSAPLTGWVQWPLRHAHPVGPVGCSKGGPGSGSRATQGIRPSWGPLNDGMEAGMEVVLKPRTIRGPLPPDHLCVCPPPPPRPSPPLLPPPPPHMSPPLYSPRPLPSPPRGRQP